MNVYCKKHRLPQYEVIAVCDEQIVGTSFGTQKISEQFYKGELMDISSAIAILKTAQNFNIAGKCIVQACIDNGIITEHGIITIESIPFAMKFLF